MVKKFLIVFFIISLNFFAKAQIASIFADEILDSAKTRVGIGGDYDLNSTAFTTSFLTKFYTGGYIDNDLKNSVLSRIKNTNRIGANFSYGVFGAFKLDSLCHNKNISIFFSVRDRFHFDAQFSKDFYEVGFYGNSKYAGKTANFNGFSLNMIRYQQFQIGLFSSKLDSAAHWGIGLSFLKGQQYLSVLAKKAELFTSADGQYIDFNTDMNAAKSDPMHNGISAFNGYGSSLDLYFEAPFQTRFGDSKMRIAVSDIGFLYFNKQTSTLKQDSIFHYTGIRVNSINDIQNSTLGSTSKDSLINSIAPYKKQSYSATLPAVLDFTFQTNFNTHFHLIEGLRNVFNGNYNLLAYVKGNFYFNSKFMVTTSIGYGGYGYFNYGLGIFAKLGKGIAVYAGSNNIEGYIAPKKTSGQGLYFSLIKNFN